MKDIVVCKAGEEVSIDLSSALQLLKLKPMEAGLNVIILCEDGKVYKKEELFVDEKEIYNDIIRGIQNAFNLSINSGYPTKENIVFMISKAFLNAKQLESELKLEKLGETREEEKEVKEQTDNQNIENKKEV